MNGHIYLDRKILEWEWYDDTNVCRLFIHLLLRVNWKDENWHGIVVKRGQIATSIKHLANETGLSVKTVRSALEKLQSTGEVGKQTTSQYSVITVLNYDKYQIKGKQTANEGQANGQTNGTQKGKQTANENAVTTPLDNILAFEQGKQTASATASKWATNEENKKEEINISCPTEPDVKKDKALDDSKMFNFEQIYKVYPKKKGKHDAFTHYLGWISTRGRCINGRYIKLTNEQMFAAVKKYVKQMQDDEKELQYYQGFDRFMNKTILDYVEGL